MESELRKLYRASFRYAVALADCSGVSKRGRKKFINNNTSFIYNDCKKNLRLKNHVLKVYGDK